MSLLARQLVVPITFGAGLPESMAKTYAEQRNDTRSGTAAVFPASAFAPEGDPSTEQLQSYYQENRARYIRPERRTIRYASFTAENLGDLPPVTDAQIAARYEADSVLYQATERRTLTQLVVLTEAAAQAVINEVNAGTSLEASAQSKQLDTTTIESVERPDYGSTASQAVAQAAFRAGEGDLAGPVRGSLGWYVVRVDNVAQIPARSLAEARDEIRETLEAERQQEALQELTERLDEQFQRGRSLTEAAEELDIEVSTTPPLLADGRVYGQPGQAPPQLARVVDFAFDLDERSAQITDLVPGQVFLIFDVDDIAPSAAAPLAEIREQVVAQWRRDQGMQAAGRAAARVLERVEGGASFAQAVGAEDVSLPAPRPLNLSRQDLAQQGEVTRATILFFSMAEGTTKRVEVPEADRWFVVQLDEIETRELAADSPEVQGVIAQFGQILGEEYVAQFVAAAENSLEVERNEDGIEAVRQQLLGTNRR
ncbi:peptidylprolyl isomerase [Aurantiacibacter aquimixticola]|uniref:Parvulin-like PPIase n=2 Tax=Aurantiacibacter aquimixticola TaxID=1958945 RepID=A0A419RWI7_9SPHN|nr:peptidylprolyl isomerase [Aurantiacibacter aquimixticola]